MSPPMDQLTTEGYDMQFGTNVVGHFLFTQLVLSLLLKAAEATGDARVVHVSSLGHAAAPKEYIAWETLRPGEKSSPGDKKRRKLSPDDLYYQSKCVSAAFKVGSTTKVSYESVQGVIMVSNEMAKRYGKQGIVSISLHPG